MGPKAFFYVLTIQISLFSLDRLQDGRLITAATFNSLDELAGQGVLGNGGLAGAAIAVQLEQLGQVVLWPLENLHLADVDIVQRVDSLAGLKK